MIEGPRPEFEQPQSTNYEKMRVVLGLFGSEKARENFLNLCREYNEIRNKHKARAMLVDGENYSRGKSDSSGQRATIHNAIMTTLGKLSMQKLQPDQQAVLNEMASRDFTAQVIHDYLAEDAVIHQEYVDSGEDDEYKKPPQSNVAYFHSLGKGE